MLIKRYIFTFFYLLGAIILFGCEKEDVPAQLSISTDKIKIKPGEEVTFTAVGGNGIYHTWQLANGQQSAGLTTTIKFDQPGKKVVKLTSINPQKEIQEVYKTISSGQSLEIGLLKAGFFCCLELARCFSDINFKCMEHISLIQPCYTKLVYLTRRETETLGFSPGRSYQSAEFCFG